MGLDISNVFKRSTLILNNNISTPLSYAYLRDLIHANRIPTWVDTCSLAPARIFTLDAYPDMHNYNHGRTLSRSRFVST